MDFRPLHHTHLLAAVVFVAAVLVLAVQLITPSPVVVSLGENGTQTTSVGQYFTYSEVSIVVVAAFAAGVSGTYLVLHDQAHVLASQSPPPTRTAARSRAETNGSGTTRAHSASTAEKGPADEDRWEETLDKLANNQETIYQLVLEADGTLPQRELVEETDLSKATVSRTLDKLENRGLVERRRNGMGNTIHLQ
ncbi:helix-turn-helix transcriptional regulator [Halorientalis brevis]|uniref:Helix-turn-helix transcriptional regulator n=1 Tax=Halorientalis brevis TaxID=1126241 RepID=A0ABD6CCA8_9EURY